MGVTVTRVLAHASAPVPSTWLGSKMSMMFALSSSGRSVAYSDPLRRPWPRGTEIVPGGTAGVRYTIARMEPLEDSMRTTSPSLTFSPLAS